MFSIFNLAEIQYGNMFSVADPRAARLRAGGNVAPTMMSKITENLIIDHDEGAPNSGKAFVILAKGGERTVYML